ncbi:MAG TPA: NmrA family NAD(P)-binding protein [Thermoanaerobaculia bacterium]|nr:NmrA family NAD(P)-binding protein [Thermoanaerobaculia bacterium]
MYAVAGVSGNTGSVVAEELLRRGKEVRVLVRDEEKGRPWTAKGAEVAVASLEDAEALGRALTGVEGAYLLNPPDMTATDAIARARRIGDVFATAIRTSGVPHVVLLSSIGAQHDSGTGPIRGVHEIEQRLLPLGINFTFLRPTFFIENWGASLAPAAQDGVLPSFLPAELQFPQIATKDIGLFAAEALLHPPTGTRILELAGPEEYSATDIANAVGSVLGKSVTVGVGPLEAVVPAYMSFGISENVASLFREMYEGLINGRVAWDQTGERKRGRTTPAEVLRPMLGR